MERNGLRFGTGDARIDEESGKVTVVHPEGPALTASREEFLSIADEIRDLNDLLAEIDAETDGGRVVEADEDEGEDEDDGKRVVVGLGRDTSYGRKKSIESTEFLKPYFAQLDWDETHHTYDGQRENGLGDQWGVYLIDVEAVDMIVEFFEEAGFRVDRADSLDSDYDPRRDTKHPAFDPEFNEFIKQMEAEA